MDVSWCQENSYRSSSLWLEKASKTSSYLLAGYNERPIIPQPHCGRCHRAGTGQATLESGGLEVIGSKSSYALKRCKPNNDVMMSVLIPLVRIRKGIQPVKSPVPDSSNSLLDTMPDLEQLQKSGWLSKNWKMLLIFFLIWNLEKPSKMPRSSQVKFIQRW